MHDLITDFRRSLRQLSRSPGFTLAAVLCLALGIGANTAVFSFADALLSRPPAVTEPERLVRAFIDWSNGLEFGAFSYPDYQDLRDRNEVLEGFAVETPIPLHIGAAGHPERVWGAIASANYFTVLGVEMARGRGFAAEEGLAPGAHAVTVLSHALWQRRFAGASDMVGRTVTINRHPFTVIGVAPAGFTGANAGLVSELWVPIMMQSVLAPSSTEGSLLESRNHHWLGFAIGRLAPGVTVAQAEAALQALMADLTATFPDTHTGKNIALYPEAEATLHPFVRGRFVGFLRLMFAVVGLVLLLACANVAGLLLARAAARERSVAIRLALGAGRGRLVRELFSDSLILAALSGALGLGLGIGLTRLLLGSFEVPVSVPLGVEAGLDGRVLAFTLLASLVTSLVFGLAPALQSTRPALAPALVGGRVAGSPGASAWRRALTVAQVAVSLVLLIASGLVLRSLANAQRMDLGFEAEGQILASVDVGLQGYDAQAGRSFFRDLRGRLENLPGVEAVGYAKLVPLSLLSYQANAIPEGHVPPEGSAGPSIDYNFVGRGYFEAMGVALFEGRGFDSADHEGPPVAIVNRTLARRFWSGAAAIGKRIDILDAEHEVVGVAGDGKYFSIGEDSKPYVYLPLERYYRGERTIHVRATGDPAALAEAVRRQIGGLDETLPVYNLGPMAGHLDFVLYPSRLAAVTAASFAALALLLAVVGLYGVLAYQVRRRTRELAIRMALGARGVDLQRWAIGRGLALTAAGLGLGLLAGGLLARFAVTVLHGVAVAEPVIYLGASGILLAAALLACWLPALKASRIDPMATLRAE